MVRKRFAARAHVIRKLFMIAAAAAIPLGAVTLGAGTTSAGAPPPPSPPLACTVSGTVTFAPPGINRQGFVSASKIRPPTCRR